MKTFRIGVETSKRTELVDITRDILERVSETGVEEGILFLYVPHTTAAITINENADPSVSKDILKEINKIVPFDDNYSHLEGNAAAHIKSTLVGVSLTIPIFGGKLSLGRWQGIFFCEFDGPRRREVIGKIIEG